MSSKPSKSGAAALHDISHHIALVKTFIGDMSYKQFSADLRTIYASVRCLEIISEASRRLPADLKERQPSIDWKNMAASGNVYRHDYEDVEAQFVWITVSESLPLLQHAVDAEIANLTSGKS